MTNTDIAMTYISNVKKTIHSFDKYSDIINAGSLIINTIKSNKRIFICGNGGSAADAQHLAAELVSRYKKERPPISAIALTTDTSIITAISNDYDYSNIFQKQILAHGQCGDLLIAISTSGQSVNVLKAIEQSKKIGMTIIGLFGSLRKDYDLQNGLAIHINSDITSIIQTIHQIIYHTWCEMIDNEY